MNKNFFLLILFFSVCILQNAPFFDETRAYSYLIKQCEFGTRYPGSKEHIDVKNFLVDFLKDKGDTLIIDDHNISHPYSNKQIQLFNLLLRYNIESENRIMLMAHWDTREIADKDKDEKNHNHPIIGANDGARGVAVLLALAEILHLLPTINIGIDLLFIDGEDQGKAGDSNSFGLGTQAFAKNIPYPIPEFAICLDMVADKEQEFLIEHFSLKQAPELVQTIWGLANNLGYTQFQNRLGYAIMDDHYYLYKYANIPAIDIIDFDYPNSEINYWHTLKDIPENCSAKSLEAVGTVMTHFIYHQDIIQP